MGIAFSMFLGPDERLQVFECPVLVLSVISEDHLSLQHQDGYVLLTTNRSSEKRNEKTHLLSVLREIQGGGGVKGTSDSILKLKYFIHAVKF
jgi:hypothetical protein